MVQAELVCVQEGDLKLNLGCDDDFLHDRQWVDVDLCAHASHVVVDDARTLAKFEDGCASFVFASHLIEHMTFEDGEKMLATCFRVLKPRGRIRISTPDLLFLARLVEGNLGPSQMREYVMYQYHQSPSSEIPYPSRCHVVNRFMRAWGHQFIYDAVTLEAAMISAGFSGVRRYSVGKSDTPELCNLEPVGRMPDGFFQLETMTMEGVKL